MKAISLCTPVWRRHELTTIMLEERVKTFARAEQEGVRCHCVLIGDDSYYEELADRLGFTYIEAPNVLARKYNDGHQWAWENGYHVSFHCNSDQVFDHRLLVELANAPEDKLTITKWLTAVNESGKKSISTLNPAWAMIAIPTKLLTATHGRPIGNEEMMSGCDQALFRGVVDSNRITAYVGGDRIFVSGGADLNIVMQHPLETIQFESGIQITPWKRWLLLAMATGTHELRVPWADIKQQHGEELIERMRKFYGV